VYAFIICSLSAVMATHSHSYNNQLTRVCEYRCPREINVYKYYYPDTIHIPWDYKCPPEKRVKIWTSKDK